MKNGLLPILAIYLFILLSSCQKENVLPNPVSTDTIGKNINDSLWAYYPIKGSVADSSGNNHSLNLLSGASLTYDIWGNDDGAINFDGNSNYAVIPDGSQFTSTDFSVSFFIMPRQNKGFFFSKHDYNTGKAASFNIGIDGTTVGTTARFSITSNQENICNEIPSSGELLMNSSPFYSYAWYHVVATFKEGLMKLYINGDLVGSKTIHIEQIKNCNNSQFILGAWWSGDLNLFNGKMDELRIYTREITSEEIKWLFNKI